MLRKKAILIPTQESLQEILDLIGNKKSTVRGINGIEYTVNSCSLRLRTFKAKGVTCPECGISGTHWAITSNNGKFEEGEYHLNLMSDNTLMTCDHIVPKSKGGLDYLFNTQPMCYPCNSRLGSKD